MMLDGVAELQEKPDDEKSLVASSDSDVRSTKQTEGKQDRGAAILDKFRRVVQRKGPIGSMMNIADCTSGN